MPSIEYEMTTRDGSTVRELLDLPKQMDAALASLMRLHGAKTARAVSFHGTVAVLRNGTDVPLPPVELRPRRFAWARRNATGLIYLTAFASLFIAAYLKGH